MASRSYARPLTPEDEAALAEIDRAYAERFGLEPVVTAGSLSFYARSGHAFVSCRGEEPSGFILAHAVWAGARAAIQSVRLAVAHPEDAESRALLAQALTKSAYDAAVYDLHILLPEADERGKAVLATWSYRRSPEALYMRVLGSRGRESE